MNELTFEQAAGRLEEIAAELEQEGVELDRALKLYGEGAKLIEMLNRVIEDAEKKIKKLSGEEIEDV